MLNEIYVYPGRLKNFALQWRQGSPTGPVLNTTGASFAILRNSLPAAPTITPVDETQGQYTLAFTPDCTRGLKSGATFSLTVALTLPGPDAGYSPDPIVIQGVIQ